MKFISKINILRFTLLGDGLGWGLTVVGVFIPWEFAAEHLEVFGGSGPIPDDTMLNYLLRMAAGAFGIVGFFFLISAWKPDKYKNIIPLLGWLSLFEGCVLLYYGLLLNLNFFPFVVDVSIGIIPGVIILVLKDTLD